jgi:benzoyl-CoA reductase/2-hydroxyglutaryl-CoA dehydratase subunit BcrC/BadD/HgdB
MQAFMLDNVESWTDRVETLLGNYHRPRTEVLADVFLAGSPILFPNFKLLELIEEAGMFIAADELCTSERNLTSVPVYDDLSEYGLLKALSERSMLSCHCPTFTDNRRREKNILDTMRTQGMSGVIFHVLKGCHPYDIESFAFEKSVRERGFHFLKIETDYSQEDRQAILTRLEAFRGTLD